LKRENLQTILYVDDEPDIREVVELSLGLAPQLQVHTCDSGHCALQKLPELRPDLLLLDVMMPGLDGPATFKQMQAEPQLANIPVIFMTAKAMPQEIQRFRQLGAIGVISKPFDPMQLAEQVFVLWEGL
jgi:two-component system OmpR family response regulator